MVLLARGQIWSLFYDKGCRKKQWFALVISPSNLNKTGEIVLPVQVLSDNQNWDSFDLIFKCNETDFERDIAITTTSIATLRDDQFVDYLGRLKESQMKEIEAALKFTLDL